MQPSTPYLTICVPSRNRQSYFQETIKALTQSPREDVEFVFVDNSDDPSVINGFIEPFLADPRVKYIPTGEKIRPMIENWEVAAQATTGSWVVFIGDDDYMDPDAAGLFRKIEQAEPNVEAIDWGKISYFWPDETRPAAGQAIPLTADTHKVPKSLLMARAFQWQSAKRVLVSGFSIYHSAISRRLLDRIRSRYSNRYFEHPIVDYDSLLKNVLHGEGFVFISRPLSVLGACPLSNTAAIGDRNKEKETQKQFHKEHAVSMDDWECYKDYPFRSRHGVTACIGMTHHWFSKTYGHNFTGYEANFAKACAVQCEEANNHEQFTLYRDAYRDAFKAWKGGRYLKYFQPVYRARKTEAPFVGYSAPNLFVFEGSSWTRSVHDFYRIVNGIITPVDDIVVDLDRHVVDVTDGAGQQDLKRAGVRG